MNGILRSGAVVAALSTLAVTVITRYQAIINDSVLVWFLIGGGAALLSLIFSWGWTYAYRVLFVDVDFRTPPNPGAIGAGNLSLQQIEAQRMQWLAEVKRAKRGVFLVAMIFCLIPSQSLGAVIFLMDLAREQRVVCAMIWGISSLALSGASPWLWKVVFEVAWPWMLAKEKTA